MRRDPHPLLRIGLALTLFNSWVLFEEIIVDRLGWWRYMPCYQVGRFCEWDVAAIVGIVLTVIVAFDDSRTRSVLLLREWCGGIGCKLCTREVNIR